MRAVIQFDGAGEYLRHITRPKWGTIRGLLRRVPDLWLDESWGSHSVFVVAAGMCLLPQCPTILLASGGSRPTFLTCRLRSTANFFFPVIHFVGIWHLAWDGTKKKEWKCRTPSPSPVHTSDTSFPVISVSHQRSGLIRSTNNTSRQVVTGCLGQLVWGSCLSPPLRPPPSALSPASL
jgi:hypothetical protein